MLIQWNPLLRRHGLGRRQRYRQDGIGTEFGFVVSAIGLDHRPVQSTLIRSVFAD